jgi:hypothetical protein
MCQQKLPVHKPYEIDHRSCLLRNSRRLGILGQAYSQVVHGKRPAHPLLQHLLVLVVLHSSNG